MTKTSLPGGRFVLAMAAAALGALAVVALPTTSATAAVAPAAFESAPVGYGAGTTGGAGGSTVTVTSASALASAVADNTARIVRVSGTFTGTSLIKIGSNKTIIGVLAGVHGHGRAHLFNLRRLHDGGLIRLVGVCDPVPPGPDQLVGFGRPAKAADLATLLGRVDTDITVVATPIHTHADLAITALATGSAVLLEKPPTPTAAEFRRLLTAVAAHGTACQVGFQSLGSAAVTEVRALIAAGRIGRVRGIGVAGCWTRDAAYFARTPWAGHRSLGDTAVTDGVLTNPFAHGVATALRLEGSEAAGTLAAIETELFHAYPIESDDTSCLRLRTARGTVITVAASVCGPRRFEPYVLVHGETGRIVLWYTLDRVELWPERGDRVVSEHPRVDLLENLVAHLRDRAELLVPLHRTGAFTDVVDAVGRAPDPRPIPVAEQLVSEVDGRVQRRVVVGIERLVRRSAERLALFSELAVSWAGQVP